MLHQAFLKKVQRIICQSTLYAIIERTISARKGGLFNQVDNNTLIRSINMPNVIESVCAQVKMNCCYLAVIQEFQTAVIYQFFGSSLAVQSFSLCKLIICIKAFQWQLTAVLQHSQFFSSKQGRNIYELIKKQQFSTNIKMRTALKLLKTAII